MVQLNSKNKYLTRMKPESNINEVSLANRMVIIIMPLFGCLASMVSGYFIVYFTMLEEQFKLYHHFSAAQNDRYFTMMVTALPVGAFFGSFIYNRFVNSLGQNQAMKILDILAIIAALLQVITLYLPVVLISRLLMGFYCGITTGLIPSWILSMSPNRVSGIFGTFSYLAIVIGMALAYCMGEFLETDIMSDSWKLSFYIGIPIATSLVHLFGLRFFGFDNIQRLIQSRDHSEVIRFLKRMYGRQWRKFEKQIRHFKMTPIEVINIKEESEQTSYAEDEEKEVSKKVVEKGEEKGEEKEKKKTSFFTEVKKKLTLLSLKNSIKDSICDGECESGTLGIILAVANQTSGIFAILQYSKQLFDKIEENNAEADKNLLYLGFFQVLIVFISGFFINRYGRRNMMLIGQVIVMASLFLCTIVTLVMEKHEIIVTCAIFIYFFGYSISMGPLFMMYTIEALLDIQMVIKIYWGLMIVFTLTTDILIEEIGVYFMFGFFFVCSTVSFFYFKSKMVETKDVPKKEIKQLINKNEFLWENSEILFSKTIKKGKEVEKTLGVI